jgi:hypothetical protein
MHIRRFWARPEGVLSQRDMQVPWSIDVCLESESYKHGGW